MRSVVFALAAFLCAGSVSAQGVENVLVVVNEASAESRELGEYYIKKRGIPPDQVVRLKVEATDEISRETYDRQIEAPITSWLGRNTAHDRILYIVLMKGVPLRVSGTTGQSGTIASVDSELTLLYRKLAGFPVVLAGPVQNPYFLGEAPVRDARRFTHERHDIYLVTRLDGFTVADVKALIDRGSAPSKDGTIVLDGRVEVIGSQTPGNTWLRRSADTLQQLEGWRDRVTIDMSGRLAGNATKVLGYYGWGSNDVTQQILGAPKLNFVPGALAALFVSTDARTFREPPEGWSPGSREFAGSAQSLTGSLIRDGASGAAGHVAEPYLVAAIRPDVLFPAYVSGLNLAEAFYAAMPFVSWQTVVIGDPLCAPFRQAPLDRNAIDPGPDPVSELPTFFTAHWMRSPVRGSAAPEAWKLMLRAAARRARGDQAGARSALEQATAADDDLVAGHLSLALLYETSSEWDAAIVRYKRVLDVTPDNAIALNNLAYTLAARKNQAAEALPLAERAYKLSKGQPAFADTLAWVYHLLGQSDKALPLIRTAAEAAPRNADIRLHAAFILAAVDNADAAQKELSEALALNKTLGEREDVRRLQERLRK